MGKCFKQYQLKDIRWLLMRKYFTTLNAILPSNHGITKKDFQIENICVLSCRSNLHVNLHYSKFVATQHVVQIWFFILCTLCRQQMYNKACLWVHYVDNRCTQICRQLKKITCWTEQTLDLKDRKLPVHSFNYISTLFITKCWTIALEILLFSIKIWIKLDFKKQQQA